MEGVMVLASFLDSQMTALLFFPRVVILLLYYLIGVSLCAQIFPFYRDPSQTGLELILT